MKNRKEVDDLVDQVVGRMPHAEIAAKLKAPRTPVPDDLINAARMDGMSEFSIIWKVMLPTAIPALLAFAIFSVVAHWNDYYWPRVVITGDRDLMTPPLGLRMFKSDMDGNEYGPMMAAATIIVTPLVVAFLLAQRRFIEGITLTGMK